MSHHVCQAETIKWKGAMRDCYRKQTGLPDNEYDLEDARDRRGTIENEYHCERRGKCYHSRYAGFYPCRCPFTAGVQRQVSLGWVKLLSNAGEEQTDCYVTGR